MRSFLLKRLVAMAVTVVAVTTALFFMIRLAPGDPATTFVSENLPLEQIEAIRESWGLDEPLVSQYVSYIGNMLTFDFGTSFTHRQPVTSLLGEAIVNSVLLLVPALVVMTIVGVVLGAAAGWMRGTPFEKATVFGALLGRGMPSFFIGMVLLLVLAYRRTWFPPGGMSAPGELGGAWSMVTSFDFWKHLALPALAIALSGIYGPLLLMRTSIIEFRGEDFVDVLRAKGLPRWRVISHAARNGMLPVLTATAVTFAFVLDGQVVIEQVFAWPGAGRLIVQSMIDRDYPVLQAVFFIAAVAVVVANLVADLLYRWLDPRVRYES